MMVARNRRIPGKTAAIMALILALSLAGGCGAPVICHERTTDYLDGRHVHEKLFVWLPHALIDPKIASVKYGNTGTLTIERISIKTDNEGISAVVPSLFDMLGKLFGL
jgi:hypothetical protein